MTRTPRSTRETFDAEIHASASHFRASVIARGVREHGPDRLTVEEASADAQGIADRVGRPCLVYAVSKAERGSLLDGRGAHVATVRPSNSA